MVKTYNIENDCRHCNSYKLIGDFLHIAQSAKLNNDKWKEIKMINICRDCYDNEYKQCLYCKQDKLYNEFCFNKHTYDGLNKYCKQCAYDKVKRFKKDYDPATYERYKEYYKQYYKKKKFVP